MDFPNISPIALDFGLIQIHWYALAYLAGILLGWIAAVKNTALYPTGTRPHKDDIEDLIVWIVFGIILGGRLGYGLFYNAAFFIEHPLEIFKTWQGGMSFHGGVIGVIVALVGYALRHKISILRLGDVIASVVPIGLFFGRVTNFINAELWGRVTDVPWGVVFPYAGDAPRHPSQLYEAVLEGALLFIVLNLLIRQKAIRERPGIVAGIFFIGYGLSRIVVEFFREPDAHIGFLFDGVTMGQILSVPMVLLGIGFILYAVKRHERS